MKSTGKVLALLLCTFILIGLAGCGQDSPTAETSLPTQTTDPGADIYNDAAARVAELKTFTLQIASTESIRLGEVTFSSDTTQTILMDLSGEELKASVTETVIYADHTVNTTETYIDGKVYSAVSDYRYVSEMTAEDFRNRYFPSVLLDAALYRDIATSNDHKQITFANPSALESWAAAEAAQLISAAGTAILDEQGSLVSTSYEASYRSGASHIESKTVVTISIPEECLITAPEDADSYTPIDYIDAYKTLESAYGYLTAADYITSSYTKSIISQAVGVVRSHQHTVNVYGSGDAQMVSSNQSIQQVNFSTGGTPITEQQEIVYRDGKYVVSTNGGELVEDPQITAEAVQLFYQNMLVSNILDASYIQNATCTELGTLRLLNFTCTDSIGDALCAEVNYALFQDEAFLTNLSSDYQTDSVSVYLAVDRATGLPTATGIAYSGTHNIQTIEYKLSMQVDQSFDFVSTHSYEAITGESLPESPAEITPTPLLYRVTTTEGGEIWLLGAPTVGDSRTANLPKELKTAFEKADALAVSYNPETYAHQLQTDEVLRQQLDNAYYYAGTTTLEHITDQQIYEQGLDLMKASGNYNYNTEYLKAALWASQLQDYYIQQEHALSEEKSIASRLLKLADQEDKQIIEIEAGISLAELYGNLSDPVQELLLKNTLAQGSQTYYEQTSSLYELWCIGDENAIKEALARTAPVLSEEEQLIYQEYIDAFHNSRSVQILEHIKNWLESGTSVFCTIDLSLLLAQDGLVALLQDAGYTVETVTYQ